MTKRIAFIIGAEPENAPYIKYYSDILKNQDVCYDIICWDRDGMQKDNVKSLIVYRSNKANSLKATKVFDYCRFRHFVLKSLKKYQYDGFIVVGLQLSFFLFSQKIIRSKVKYIIDIRDYSSIYRLPIIRRIINYVFHNSYANIISSEGFKSWLPSNELFFLSHNIDEDLIDTYHPSEREQRTGPIIILTIGQLRDFGVTKDLIAKFSNNPKYELHFAGDGIALPLLQKYVNDNHIMNVKFSGRYSKKDELDIVKHCDLMNIFLPNNKLSRCLTSNRFYLSVLMNKPMIVNANCFQAELAVKYRLGIVTSLDTIVDDIFNYIHNRDWDCYVKNCKIFLDSVKQDEAVFKSKVIKFLESL